jgi:small-conductance mechanosensitive channel
MQRFEEEGIEFAYPTQTILLGQGEGPELFSETAPHPGKA